MGAVSKIVKSKLIVNFRYLENSQKYKSIVHQWDVWHGAKNIAKKVIAVS
jgi:hypothetical protein